MELSYSQGQNFISRKTSAPASIILPYWRKKSKACQKVLIAKQFFRYENPKKRKPAPLGELID
jgi:hypothetical protein